MASNRTFEEYDPAVEWSRSAEADAVKISLPGFKRDEIRVLVDNHGHLRTRGERHIAGNRWIRFQKDFELPTNCNTDGIRAKFESEMLTITLPKNTPSPPMPPPPRMPMPAPPRMPTTAPAVPEPVTRPTAPPPTVPAAPLAPAPSVKPPVEPRPSMPRKPPAPVLAPAPAPAPEVEPPAATKGQSPLAAVQRPKEEDEEEKQRAVREAAGKFIEDRKKEMAQEKATEQQQQQQEAMPPADGMSMANLQPRPASASRGLLVNVAVAVVVLLGITVYVWHSLRNATGRAGEHGHGHLGAGSYGDEM